MKLSDVSEEDEYESVIYYYPPGCDWDKPIIIGVPKKPEQPQ